MTDRDPHYARRSIRRMTRQLATTIAIVFGVGVLIYIWFVLGGGGGGE